MELGKYKHYKGEVCEVMGVGHHSETLEKLVFYRALKDSEEFGKDALWVRPVSMFEETVERDGETFPRFEKI
ncbi:hypothetical protein COB52_02165 [Candidatus Kaiserbacteria bacterium]|nr:MAG: hypothetical protein COB52_02165 [Candidatus Kaiserbacteria bacterium]